VIEWTGDGTGSGLWSTATNWSTNALPGPDADVLFGNDPSGPEEAVEVDSAQTLGSLWLDAAVAYELDGAALTLGSGLADGEHLVAVMSTGGDFGAETNINNATTLADNGGTPRTWVIENESEGGLRFGGPLDLGTQNLLLTGGQATHFHGDLTGSGNLTITGPSGQTIATPTHLALQGENSAWSGSLNIGFHTMGIVKSETAFGNGAHSVQSGGTLAWRHHQPDENTSYPPTTSAQPISVSGQGVVRQDGTLPVGAIYNDGGRNLSFDALNLTGDTWFGARGGLRDLFALIGPISDGGAGHAFIKVGPGLIMLADSSLFTGDPPASLNTWGRTIIRDGVLQIGSEWGLPSANVALDGGILELAAGDFSRDLGTGTGEIQWTGHGGFSAANNDASVSLNGGAALTWGQAHFVQNGHALLLGSRYSDASITLTNDIALGLSATGNHREIRVAEMALAMLSGQVSGTHANTGLLKTGSGLLFLANGDNDYSGPTIIRGGALVGALSPNSNLQLDGGVLGLMGTDFLVNLGSTSGELQWTGSGGFASLMGDVTVRLGNSTAPITWGAPHFVADGAALHFGNVFAQGTVIWDKALNLGNGTRTIHIEAPTRFGTPPSANVLFTQTLAAGPQATLTLTGNGRLDLSADNDNFQAAQIQLYGAELRLHSDGRLAAAPSHFLIKHGGTLTLDNIGTHNDSETGGSHTANRIHDASDITLDGGGTLSYRGSLTEDSSEKIGKLILEHGANRLAWNWDNKPVDENGEALARTELHIQKIERSSASHSVLELDGLLSKHRNYLRLDESADAYAINDGGGIKVIPWAVSANWFMPHTEDGKHYLLPIMIPSGNDLDESLWTAADNPHAAENVNLSASRSINVLRLGDTLNLNSHTLTLRAGGLQNGGKRSTISGTPGSQITTVLNRPLYIHTASAITLEGHVALSGGMDLVLHYAELPGQAQAGSAPIGGIGGIGPRPPPGHFFFKSHATHYIRSLYIQSGHLSLEAGTLALSGNDARVYIGDGAGTDILQLAPNRRNQIIKTGGGLPSITLHGTLYHPHGPEYADTPQAILQMGGNTKLSLANLHIEKRGTIDWVGGEIGRANILYLDTLTFSGPDAILFMRNWYEYEDILLVRSGGFDLSYLKNIRFEGYENFPNIWRRYNENYYQITPFGASTVPEPSTTGAILGTEGLGLWLWRRRRRAVPASTHARATLRGTQDVLPR